MSVDPTTVSVIICAYALDRWVDICDAVKSVMLQRPPVGEIIIVVDHNPELLSRLRAQFPGHRVVANREAPGLSGARNTGVCAARGCLLAFLDDDAVAAPDWVAGMLRHFVKPSVLGVTTRVMPIWQGPRPPWFPDEFLWVLGCTHAGLRSGPVRNLMGGSMCLSRDVFDRAGGFNGDLGRRRNKLPLGAEETELCIRAAHAIPHAEFRYDAQVVTGHKVKAERLTWRYFVRRCYAEGLSKAQVAAISSAAAPLATERAYVVRTLMPGSLRGVADGCLRFDLHGFGRSFAIAVGLVSTVTGFLVCRLSMTMSRRGAMRRRPGNHPLRN
jgi:GT2 family glycosyltransferase